MYENKKILILGAAKSGVAVAKLLAAYPNDITLSDIKELDSDIRKELEGLGVKIIITPNQIDLVSKELWQLVRSFKKLIV